MDLGSLRLFNLGFTSSVVSEAYKKCSPYSKKFTLADAFLTLGGMTGVCIGMSIAIIWASFNAETWFIKTMVLSTVGLILVTTLLFVFVALFFIKTYFYRTIASTSTFSCINLLF